MAIREENLKKINEELEKLSDDELEKVAGGYDSLRHCYSVADGNQNNYSIPNRLFAENQLGRIYTK